MPATTPTKALKENCIEYASSIEQISSLVKAQVPIIWVITHEEKRFVANLYQEVAEAQKRELWTWSSWQGISGFSNTDIMKRASGEWDKTWNVPLAFDKIASYKRPKDKKGAIFVLKDFHTVFSQGIPRHLRDMYQHLIDHQKTLIITAPCISHGPSGKSPGIELTLDKQITVVNYELPTRDQIMERIKETINHIKDKHKDKKGKIQTKLDYTDEEYLTFATALQGLTETEADNALFTCVTHLKRVDPQRLLLEKKQIVQKSDILEYIDQMPGMDVIGGLDAAKTYFSRYDAQFSPEAREFGVEPLRGVLLTGVPGTGKSLLAKSISALWNLPLLRLDVGKVMTGLVGGSIRGNEEIIWFDKNKVAHRNTIADLVEQAPENCYVHTYNDAGESKLERVQSFIPHELKLTDKLYELSMSDGRKIVTTGDHGVMSYTEELLMKEVRIDSLKPGDLLAMPGTIIQERVNAPGSWTDGFFAGAWLGDGDYNKKDVRYHLNNKDITAFTEILSSENKNFSVYSSTSSNEAKVVHVKNLRSELENDGFVGNSHTKRVPEQVFGYSNKYIAGLLCGYFSTDGSFTNHVLEVSSVSKKLRDDITHLLHRFGIHGYIAQTTNTSGFRTKEGTDYILRISSQTDLDKFEKNIGFFQEYKSEKLINRINNTNYHGYHIPLTQKVKDETNAMRRQMWKKLHRRPYGYDYRATTIGLKTIENCYKFAKDNLYSEQDYPIDDFAHTLKRSLSSDIRWISVKSIIKVDKNPEENTVYDLSIPGHGIEKFVAGSCPLLVHNSEQKMRECINQAEAIAPCVTGDTLVQTDQGNLPIEQLYSHSLYPIKIRTIDPETGEVIDNWINKILRRNAQEKNLLQITTESGKTIKVTTNHRLLVQLENQQYIWKEAKDLTEDDNLVELDYV